MASSNKKAKMSTAKRLVVILLSVLLFVLATLGALQLGCVYTHRGWKYFFPDYGKVDLSPILEKSELSEDDYELLYRQTGLTKLGIDGYLEGGQTDGILRTQQFFFQEQEVIVDKFAPFTYTEKTDAHAPIAPLKDGDIIVTSTTRVSWWRYGHAALVVDGKKSLVIESISPGAVSKFNYATTFDDLRDFMILRPKASAELKAQVTEYAKNELLGLPYSLFAGIFTKKFNDKPLESTQCAHLVWHAYKKFGIDLDSTGGRVVKPRDMACSPEVELVQAYGFDLDTLWS